MNKSINQSIATKLLESEKFYNILKHQQKCKGSFVTSFCPRYMYSLSS